MLRNLFSVGAIVAAAIAALAASAALAAMAASAALAANAAMAQAKRTAIVSFPVQNRNFLQGENNERW